MPEQDGIQLTLFTEEEIQGKIDIETQTGEELIENLTNKEPQLKLEFPN